MSEKEIKVNTLKIKAKRLVIEPEMIEIKRPTLNVTIEEEGEEEVEE